MCSEATNGILKVLVNGTKSSHNFSGQGPEAGYLLVDDNSPISDHWRRRGKSMISKSTKREGEYMETPEKRQVNR